MNPTVIHVEPDHKRRCDYPGAYADCSWPSTDTKFPECKASESGHAKCVNKEIDNYEDDEND